jgi:hypothetical protein
MNVPLGRLSSQTGRRHWESSAAAVQLYASRLAPLVPERRLIIISSALKAGEERKCRL